MITELGLNNIYPTFLIMDNVNECINQYEKIPVTASTSYVKYTSKETVFNMLESDSLYLFCSELSNDYQENKFLYRANPQDAYITCFYHNIERTGSSTKNCSDVYSQWMSYCHNGGAAFEFYFYQDILSELFKQKLTVGEEEEKKEKGREFINKHSELFDFSLLSANSDAPDEYIKYSVFPHRVQYYENDIFAENNILSKNENTYISNIERTIDNLKIDVNYISPYFKHSGFVQESEARLAIVNYNNQISKCIRFMNKSNGTRIPYIIAKFGDNDKALRPCVRLDPENKNIFENSESIINYISEIPRLKRNPRHPIVIPQGRNQEEIYEIVEKEVCRLEKEGKGKFSIICQGHLPITKITLAPTMDRKEQKKTMEIFCKSKYWLRHVEICESLIPYNTNNINHL